MDKILDKAIQGGWKPPTKEQEKMLGGYYRSDCILDPIFWQALSKACGWKVYQSENIITKKEVLIEMWLEHAKRFHEINLTEGWSKAVEYLEDLIK